MHTQQTPARLRCARAAGMALSLLLAALAGEAGAQLLAEPPNASRISPAPAQAVSTRKLRSVQTAAGLMLEQTDVPAASASRAAGDAEKLISTMTPSGQLMQLLRDAAPQAEADGSSASVALRSAAAPAARADGRGRLMLEPANAATPSVYAGPPLKVVDLSPGPEAEAALANPAPLVLYRIVKPGTREAR